MGPTLRPARADFTTALAEDVARGAGTARRELSRIDFASTAEFAVTAQRLRRPATKQYALRQLSIESRTQHR
jgi:hypothetical protein